MKTTKPYKIILADDHILLRDALENLINNFKEFKVLHKAADGSEVIELLEKTDKTDILLMDLNMPKMDGCETAMWVTRKYPHIKTVILTMYDTEMMMIRLLQAGVCGFLKKDIHPEELHAALLTIAAGDYYYSNPSAAKVVSHFRNPVNNQTTFQNLLLSEPEIEFIKLCTTDLTYVEIARAMRLKPRNIDHYRQALFSKLQVGSRVGLAIFAARNGLLTI